MFLLRKRQSKLQKAITNAVYENVLAMKSVKVVAILLVEKYKQVDKKPHIFIETASKMYLESVKLCEETDNNFTISFLFDKLARCEYTILLYIDNLRTMVSAGYFDNWIEPKENKELNVYLAAHLKVCDQYNNYLLQLLNLYDKMLLVANSSDKHISEIRKYLDDLLVTNYFDTINASSPIFEKIGKYFCQLSDQNHSYLECITSHNQTSIKQIHSLLSNENKFDVTYKGNYQFALWRYNLNCGDIRCSELIVSEAEHRNLNLLELGHKQIIM